MSENICISGGAQGADSLFALCASQVGHKVRHLSFPKHGVHSKIGEKVDVISGNEEKWDKQLKAVNDAYLNRPINGMAEYSKNLLRRNMAIADESKSLYAVTYLSHDGVGGGTAWGVYRAYMLDISIYLFDQNFNKWYTTVDVDFGIFLSPTTQDKIPFPSGPYGAIGSRKLTESGINAIRGVYKIGE